MSEADCPKYDFLAASRVERPLAAALRGWMAKFATIFSERWRDFAPSTLKISPLLIHAMSFEAVQNRWRQNALAVPFSIKGDQVHGLIVTGQADVVILMMEILLETLESRPQNRELTSIEQSMFRLFAQQMAASLGEAWPEKDAIPVTIGEIELQPNRLRMFQPKKEVLVTGFEFRTQGGDRAGAARFEWIIAKEELQRLLGVREAPVSSGDGPRIPFENLHPLAVEMVASLGSAELHMNELLHLAPGDIVQLNQEIEKPLTLFVDQRPFLAAWAGRQGKQQALMIEAVLADEVAK